MLRRYLGLLVLASISQVGCSESLICTDVGCFDGIYVELSRALPDSFSVSIETSEGTVVREFPYGRDIRWVSFHQLTPDFGTVRVGWSAVSVETTVTFDYVDVRPNGPDCGPECRQASVAVHLP